MASETCAQNHAVEIEGLMVMFPKKPYDCQVEYMKCTIQALNRAENALLESPTGTGKTLSLLCSSLAWQQKRIEEVKKSRMAIQGLPSTVSTNPVRAVPNVIIYASRTHSQLTQVVKELKSSSYRPVMAVLGSRDQLCVNERLSKLKGNALNQACSNITMKRGCSYKNNLEMRSSNKDNGNLPDSTAILDIEDLVKHGKSSKFCSYFYSKDISADAELILLPYNYLLDHSMRARLSIGWENSVVIFDEAHNVEQVASSAASFSLTSSDIAACIEELQTVLRVLRDRAPSMNESSAGNETKTDSDVVNIMVKGELSPLSNPTLENTMQILKCMFNVETRLDSIPLSMCGVGSTPACVLPGNWLQEMLIFSGFEKSLMPKVLEEIQKCITLLTQEAQDAMLYGNELGVNLSLAEPRLNLLSKALTRVFKYTESNSRISPDYNDYKVYICEKERDTSNGSNHRQMIKNRVLNYWGFSPGIGMEDLKRLGVRSIIMTSGTLSPMDSFVDDMKIPFPIQLQNQHVISDKQIWVGAMANGSNGKQLNSSFSNRDSNEYKDELGNSILKICQTMIGSTRDAAPELTGGILIFFPSYGSMDNVISRWKESGLYNKLAVAGGGIVIEPKGVSSTASARAKSEPKKPPTNNKKISFLDPKTTAVESSDDPDTTHMLHGVVGEFESTLRMSRRCILLAVCRGKVSEGIDFSDDRGRVVIITGLPYSPHMDPWIILKKQYLDEKVKLGKMSVTTSANAGNQTMITKNNTGKSSYLTGQEWYQQSAMRAVNQAIGRVIRHQKDWGAILLMDDRFLGDRQKNQLSKWVRPRHQSYSSFLSGMANLRQFFTIALNDPSLNPNKALPSSIEPRIIRSMPKDLSHMNSSIFSNEAVIYDTDIPTQPDGTTFIDPKFLRMNYDTDSISYRRNTINPDDELNLDLHFKKSDKNDNMTATKIDINKNTSTIESIFNRKNRTISSSNNDQSIPESKVILKQKTTILYDSNENREISSNSSQDKSHMNPTRKFTLSNVDSISDQVARVGSDRKYPSDSITSKGFSFNLSKRSSQKSTVALSSSSEEYLRKIFTEEQRQAFQDIMVDMKYIDWNDSEDVKDMMKQVADMISFLEILHVSKVLSILKLYLPLQNQDDFFSKVFAHIEFLKREEREEIKAKLVGIQSQTQVQSQSSSSSALNALLKGKDIIKPKVKVVGANQEQEMSSLFKSEDDCDFPPVIESLSQMSSTKFASQPTVLKGSGVSSQLSQSQSNRSNISTTNKSFQPSKRALAMIGASKENTENPTSLSKKQKLNEILGKVHSNVPTTSKISSGISSNDNTKISSEPKKNFFQKMQSENLNLPDDHSRKQVSTSKISCIVCREVAMNPCAATCGHICCEECWSIWFKTKKSCPICRTEITAKSISKLIVK